MNRRDYIGSRGEALFRVMITEWCGHDRPWFQETFLGEKYATKDFMVNLVNPTSGDANFFVQVKATQGRYIGTGPARRLNVRISKAAMKLLKKVPAPVFVVGIDIESREGYVVQVTKDTPDRLASIPLTEPLNCATIKAIWKWVDKYWATRNMLPGTSAFD